MIYPIFPKSGDTIGICAPSAGVGVKLDSFNLSIETLRERGFEIIETASVRNEDYPSAPAEVRGAEFNSLFDSESVQMVLCASGGDYCMEMLPFIDQELVRKNPKWFCGYSDPTSIEMLLTTKLDIATIYGSNAGSWDWRPLHEFQETSLSVLSGYIPVQHSYEFYSSKGFDNESMTYEMDAPVDWKLYVAECENLTNNYSEAGTGEGPLHCSSHNYNSHHCGSHHFSSRLVTADTLNVSGRLIGGCIDVLDWIIGTPYEDLEGFCRRYAEDGFIWYFDNFELSPLLLQYALRKMQLKGLFENAKAVIIGRTLIPGDASDDDYLAQLERVFVDINVPLIWNADIGHTKPSLTIINGALGHLTYNCGDASLSMELK